MFTSEEVKMLFDGLDALESKSAIDDLMVSVFGAALSRSNEERKEFLDKQKQEKDKQEYANQILKERIILLKAKLIQMKDKAFIEELD